MAFQVVLLDEDGEDRLDGVLSVYGAERTPEPAVPLDAVQVFGQDPPGARVGLDSLLMQISNPVFIASKKWQNEILYGGICKNVTVQSVEPGNGGDRAEDSGKQAGVCRILMMH